MDSALDVGLSEDAVKLHNRSVNGKRALDSMKPALVEQGALSMTYIPTETGYMRLEDSEKQLYAIFSKLSRPGTLYAALYGAD